MWDYKLIKTPKGAFSTRSLAQDLFTLVNFGYLCCTATCRGQNKLLQNDCDFSIELTQQIKHH